MYTSFFTLALFAAPLVSAHGLVSSASGDQGGKGRGLGVAAGGDNNQGDVTVFKTGNFGATGAGAAVDPNTDIAAMIAQTGATIPQVGTSNGVLTLVYHQINADGAGPVSCSVSADATGDAFTAMTITTQVPGTNGRSNAANADFPLVAQMPAGTTCTGTVGGLKNVCIVKCANPAGPFGSNIPVQQSGGSAAAAPAAAPPASSAASSSATAATTTAVAAAAAVESSTSVVSGITGASTGAAVAAAGGNSTAGAAAGKKGHKHHKGHKGKAAKKGKKTKVRSVEFKA